jgi:hypothetical protein
MSFTWQKYLLQLRNAGSENLYQNFKSARGTRIVTIEVWFEDGNGGNCGLEVVSSYANHNTTLKEPGWSGFRIKRKTSTQADRNISLPLPGRKVNRQRRRSVYRA